MKGFFRKKKMLHIFCHPSVDCFSYFLKRWIEGGVVKAQAREGGGG